MEDTKKEIMINKYPRPILIEGTKKILNQMENNICKIHKNDGIKGSGFFSKIKYNNIIIPVLITNNHVINDKYLKESNEIDLTLNDDNESKTIKLKEKRILYTNKEYDTTIIEIKPEKDKINSFIELDERVYKEDFSNNIFKSQSIYIIHYPFSEKVAVSYGIIKNINEYNIEHYCCTESGSSGSPIMNLLNHKIIGIHKEGSTLYNMNKGTFLKYPINEFINKYIIKNKKNYNTINNEKKQKIIKNNEIKGNNKNNIMKKKNSFYDNIKNEIEITIKINKDDINKDIYFLDNTNYIEKESKIKHFHDNLKELNESNVDLYINNKKYKYNKYFKPEKEGIYKIKLIIKIYIKDCSFMFAGCNNIIDINFKSFNTKNINNMKYMFSGCINLEKLDLSSFDTKNIINMEGLFGKYANISDLDLFSFDIRKPKDYYNKDYKEYFEGCINLKDLNISSFDTRNVTNMSYMFADCKNLQNLNLSSFDTKNVTNMMSMFYCCENLKNLNISSFNTKKVINMSFMFVGCKNLSDLNLSSFDTKNVNNMSFMFGGCINLKDLNLSSFDTSNVTNMMGIFGKCANLKYLNISSFDTKNVNNMFYMFMGCEKLVELNISSFDTKNVNNMSFMFGGCENLKDLNVSSFNTKNVTNMIGMFCGCKNLKNLNLSSFDTKNVTNMSYMFGFCQNLKDLNLSFFDTNKVTDVECIFTGCTNLKDFRLSPFKRFKKEEMTKDTLPCIIF